VFGAELIGALLNRLTHYAHILDMNVDNQQFKRRRKRSSQPGA
jgi:hypothetical protein